jgi:hypothetical protein
MYVCVVWARYSDWLRAGRFGDRIPMGSRFFAHVQTGPGAHPASCTMGTGSFPGVKRPGRGADHPTPSSAEVKKGKSYTSIHPQGLFRSVTRLLYLYMYVCVVFRRNVTSCLAQLQPKFGSGDGNIRLIKYIGKPILKTSYNSLLQIM